MFDLNNGQVEVGSQAWRSWTFLRGQMLRGLGLSMTVHLPFTLFSEIRFHYLCNLLGLWSGCTRRCLIWFFLGPLSGSRDDECRSWKPCSDCPKRKSRQWHWFSLDNGITLGMISFRFQQSLFVVYTCMYF